MLDETGGMDQRYLAVICFLEDASRIYWYQSNGVAKITREGGGTTRPAAS